MLGMMRADCGFRTLEALDLFRSAQHMTKFIHKAHRFVKKRCLKFIQFKKTSTVQHTIEVNGILFAVETFCF